MPNLGPMEIMVVLMVALVVLGPKRLPEAGRQVGRAVAEVRRWSQTMQAEVKAVLDDDLEVAPPAPWNPPPEPPVELPPPEPVDQVVADGASNGGPPQSSPTPGPGDDRPPA